MYFAFQPTYLYIHCSETTPPLKTTAHPHPLKVRYLEIPPGALAFRSMYNLVPYQRPPDVQRKQLAIVRMLVHHRDPLHFAI